MGRNKNWTTAWTKPTNRKKEPLEMSHVEPLFIMFGAAIMASIVAFGLEFLSSSGIRMKETFAAATPRMMHRHIQHGAGASKIWILWRISTGCGRTFNQTRIFGGFT